MRTSLVIASAAAALALGSIASVAAAGSLGTETPSDEPIVPSTAVVGVNTVTGQIGDGDAEDLFDVTIPAGLGVASVALTATEPTTTGTVSGCGLAGAALDQVLDPSAPASTDCLLSLAVAGDDLGLADAWTVTITTVDVAPPEITAPSAVLASAVDASGAVVDFEVSANDNVDGPVDVVCDPASGSLFPLGDTLVTCTASDIAGNLAEASFTVTVADDQPPVITVPDDIVQPTDPGLPTVVVEFVASAVDNVDGPVDVVCAPASGSPFPVTLPGADPTTVTCTASDLAGNDADEATFTVTVLDEEPPEITVPDDFAVDATELTGAPVDYDASATDNVEVASFGCDPASGDLFGLGVTQVDCDAVDTSGNTAEDMFEVTVAVAPEGKSIDILTDDIAGQEFDNPGTGKSLAAPLSQGAKLLDDGNSANDKAVCNKTGAFLKHVDKKQQQGRISEEYAGQLTEFTDGEFGLTQAIGC